jgi:hypothetical protein
MTGPPRDPRWRSCLAARWIAARMYQLGNSGTDWQRLALGDRGILMLYRHILTRLRRSIERRDGLRTTDLAPRELLLIRSWLNALLGSVHLADN